MAKRFSLYIDDEQYSEVVLLSKYLKRSINNTIVSFLEDEIDHLKNTDGYKIWLEKNKIKNSPTI